LDRRCSTYASLDRRGGIFRAACATQILPIFSYAVSTGRLLGHHHQKTEFFPLEVPSLAHAALQQSLGRDHVRCLSLCLVQIFPPVALQPILNTTAASLPLSSRCLSVHHRLFHIL